MVIFFSIKKLLDTNSKWNRGGKGFIQKWNSFNIHIEWGRRRSWPKEETVYSRGCSKWKEIWNKGLSAAGQEWILWRKHRNKVIQAMCLPWRQLFHCVIDAVLWGKNDQTSVTVRHGHNMSEIQMNTLMSSHNVRPYWLTINSQGTDFVGGRREGSINFAK